MDQVVHAIQSGLTVVFVGMCLLLIKMWGPAVQQIITDKRYWLSGRKGGIDWTPDEKLGFGIVVGFLGNIIDNVYWGLTWAAVSYGLPVGQEMLEFGPVSNLVARQGMGIIAVYYHLAAAYDLHTDGKKLTVKQYYLFGAGVCMAMLLTMP